jgi:hypothetical protein
VPDHTAQHVAERDDILVAQRRQKKALQDLDMAGHHPAEQDLAGRGEADHDAALVIRRGRLGHQSRLGQLPELVGQSATAVDEPVGDVGHPLVPAAEPDMAALTGLIRDGGVIVTTAAPAAGDPDRSVRAVAMRLRTDADQLAALAKLVDAGELRVEISGTYPLSQAAAVHELSAVGRIRGKVLLTPAA